MVATRDLDKLRTIFGKGAKQSFASRARISDSPVAPWTKDLSACTICPKGLASRPRMRCVNDEIAIFDDLKKKQARNFQNYLRKHRFRISDYQLYQELGICIGSGSVESWIKQIGSRVKIVGAQWKPENVSQILRLQCAYLNRDISLSICA